MLGSLLVCPGFTGMKRELDYVLFNVNTGLEFAEG
jgi:hypothetical protein